MFFYSTAFYLVTLRVLGLLNILIILFHFYLYLILVKEAEYRPSCSFCEKNEYFVLLTFSESLFEINH